jgi:SulP family sulfate permease
VVFYNADYFKERLRAAISRSETPVEWGVVDASAVNVVVGTAMQNVDDLREELAARGITLAVARKKRNVERFFEGSWVNARRELTEDRNFPTLKSAINAFEHRGDRGSTPESGSADGPTRS